MNDAPITLLHLTDLHLRAEANARLHGWHVDRALTHVLEHALTRHPDFDVLVLGGDLVDDESAAGYRRLNARLRMLDRPTLALAGNHDDPAAMAQTLDAARIHSTRVAGGWRLIGLNSHWPGTEAGRLGGAQCAALERQLTGTDAPTLIFVHHPPVATGSAWLDAIGLSDGHALAAIVARHACVRGVICGHAHQALALVCGGRPCWITPSVMRQFAPRSQEFAEDTAAAPGYRWLTLAPDGGLATGVERCTAARRACG